MQVHILGTNTPPAIDCESEDAKKSCFGSEFCFLKDTAKTLEQVYNGTVYCMKVGGRKIGFVNIRSNLETSSASMTSVCILHEYRSNGFGKFMLRNVFGKLKLQGVRSVHFDIMQDEFADSRVKFYNRLGYQLHKTGEFTGPGGKFMQYVFQIDVAL